MKRVFRLMVFSAMSLTAGIMPAMAQALPMANPNQPLPKLSDLFDFYSPDQVVQQLWMTLIFVVIAYLFLFVLIRVINRRVEGLKSRHTIRKNAAYLVNFLLILSIIFIWLQRLNSLSIFLGFASAGLALALQEVILCIAGWFTIIARRPFEVGDRIELGDVKGDVIDIRLLQTAVLEIGNWVDADQSTGRIANIPNSYVFKHPNFNYTRGFEYIWNEIPVTVTFESNWRRAQEIMMSHVEAVAEGLGENVKRRIDLMSSKYMIYYEKFTPIVYVDIQDSGVRLTLRYLTEAKKRRSTTDQLSRAILDDMIKDPEVNLAYQTYRIIKT